MTILDKVATPAIELDSVRSFSMKRRHVVKFIKKMQASFADVAYSIQGTPDFSGPIIRFNVKYVEGEPQRVNEWSDFVKNYPHVDAR